MSAYAVDPRKMIELAFEKAKRQAIETLDKKHWHGHVGVIAEIVGGNLSTIRMPSEERIVPAKAG